MKLFRFFRTLLHLMAVLTAAAAAAGAVFALLVQKGAPLPGKEYITVYRDGE